MKTSQENVKWIVIFSLFLVVFWITSFYLTFTFEDAPHKFGYSNTNPLSYKMLTYKFVHLNKEHFFNNIMYMMFFYLLFVFNLILFYPMFKKEKKELLIYKILKYAFVNVFLYMIIETIVAFVWIMLYDSPSQKVILGASGVCFFFAGYFITNNFIVIALLTKHKNKILLLLSFFLICLLLYYAYQIICYKNFILINATFVFHKLGQVISLIISLFVLYLNYKKDIFVVSK